MEEVPEGVNANCVKLAELPDLLKDLTKVHTDKPEPHLASFHYELPDGNAWMFTNESIEETIVSQITLDTDEPLQVYDAMNNQLYHLEAETGGKTHFSLVLSPYESIVLVSGFSDVKKPKPGERLLTVNDGMQVSVQAYNEEQETKTDITSTGSLSRQYNDFSGTIRYRFEISLNNSDVMMVIPEAYETVHVTANDKDCGTVIAPPYVFDLETAAHTGTNIVEIEVFSTLNRAQRDLFSMYVPIEPLGIVSSVGFFSKK